MSNFADRAVADYVQALEKRIAGLEAELIDERDRRHACEKYWDETKAERDELQEPCSALIDFCYSQKKKVTEERIRNPGAIWAYLDAMKAALDHE